MLRLGLDSLHHSVTPTEVGVAKVESELHAAGNTVHGSGENIADAHGGDGVGGTAGESSLFDRQNDFRSGAERVLAPGHQNASGVAACTFHYQLIACRRGDAFDDA